MVGTTCSQSLLPQVIEHDTISCGGISRKCRTMTCPWLEINIKTFRVGIHGHCNGWFVDLIAVPIADDEIILANEELDEKDACQPQAKARKTAIRAWGMQLNGLRGTTYQHGPLKPRRRSIQVRTQRYQLPNGDGVPDTDGIIQQIGLKGPLLQETELRRRRGSLHGISRSSVAEQFRIVLRRVLKCKIAEREDVGLVAEEHASQDDAVGLSRVRSRKANCEDRADRVSYVDDFLGFIGFHLWRGRTSGDDRGGYQAAVASHVCQPADDFDLYGPLHEVVGVGFFRVSGAEAVISDDRVPCGEGTINVGIFGGLDSDVPVPAYVNGMLALGQSGGKVSAATFHQNHLHVTLSARCRPCCLRMECITGHGW